MKKHNIIDTLHHIEKEIEVIGWVDTIRDHKKVVFIDLRDRTAKLQVVGDASFAKLGPEYVVKIKGTIVKRPERLINPNLKTGTIEMQATSFEVLNESQPLPLPIDTDGLEVDEEVRLRYRHLDLRRDEMARMLRMRSDYTHVLRTLLHERSFTEVETPMLTKSTKEGSRDFVVPSRLQKGKFYALPQSPQQYKQLLMVAGVERYFQFARCIRDEDLRADRGFEHTQLDMEMSFINRDEAMQTIENIVATAITQVGGVLKDQTFPVFTHKQAMERFGADKFDLRTDQEKEKGVLAFAWVVDFPFFKKVDKDDKAEVTDGKSGWTFTHNPFSMPAEASLEDHMKGENIQEIKTTQYDLVCNGYEAGGGSIRAHKPEILEATYRIMGYNKEETRDSIGHMLDAFAFGTPPHGGIGMGLDRHIMLLMNKTSLKEAIAFPMSSGGKTAVMDAPAPLEQQQLNELGLSVKPPKE